MRTADAARRWGATWQRSWEALDPEPIIALYADDCAYVSQPFREPERAGARSYVSGAFADESDVRAWFGEPIVDGNRAAMPWWAALREAGEEVTLAGTSVLTFDAGGLVIAQWDAWNMTPGRREPPEGWSR